MTLHAASRESLALAEERLGEVLGEAGTDPATVGDELLSVVNLLAREIGVRRALSDGAAEPAARKALFRSLLGGKVSEPTLLVLDATAENRWSSPRELVDGIEALGRSALLSSAEKTGKLDIVENQLFQVARIVAAEPEFERALSDEAAPLEAKRSLVRGLFADKVDLVTEALVEQVVVRHGGRGVGAGLDELVELTAQRRERSVAHVTSASELSAEQQAQLAEKLRRIYGRQLAVHVEIDGSLGGGLVVRVGDEIIDGSTAGRIDALRRQFAG
jgi:F-type H+-transporting ATPase subunit delta